MVKSRLSGDVFEFSLISCLMERFPNLALADKRSEQRYKVLKDKVQDKYYEIVIPEVINRMKPTTLTILSDQAGIEGCSDDIQLSSPTEQCGISLKYNNFSIKHPRPSAIHKHCDLSEYHNDYTKFNDRWYRYCIDHGYHQTRDLSNTDKDLMYKECLDLLIKHLKTNVQVYQLISFCTCPKQQYVFYLEKTHRQMKIYSITNKFSVEDACNVEIKKPGSSGLRNTLIIAIGQHRFSFRVHTAATEISKTLGLKYDVKCLSDLYCLEDKVKVKVIKERPVPAPASKSTSISCQGITSKGVQCKNPGKYNGYCHHHVKSV